jgi:hypothetical protein
MTLTMHGGCGGAQLQASGLVVSRTHACGCNEHRARKRGCVLEHAAACALPQVAAGLRSRGFLSKLEAWWGAPKAAGQAAAASADGPITALRLTFTNDKEPVVSRWVRRCCVAVLLCACVCVCVRVCVCLALCGLVQMGTP